MSTTFIVICYILMAYGACNVIVFGSGPFRIFELIRALAERIGEHFGTLFSCMMCMPANFGLVFSIVDWFIIGGLSISPFNIILYPMGGAYWILAALCDGAFTSGCVWLINTIQEYFENATIITGEKEE